MKDFKKAVYVFIMTSFFYTCTNNDAENLNANHNNLNTNGFIYKDLSKQDKIKVIVAEAISYYIANNSSFNKKIFSQLLTKQNKTTELLFVLKKDAVFSNGKSLEQFLLEFYFGDQNKIELIKNINNLLPNLVVKLPQWTEVVLQNNSLELEFAIFPSVISQQEKTIYFKSGKAFVVNKVDVLPSYIPIQVKESEYLILVEKKSTITIWNNDFYKDHFPILLTCPNFKRRDYIVHSNERYHFLDKIKLNNDLTLGKLCNL